VARECDGRDRDGVNAVCPFHGRPRHRAAGDYAPGDQASARDQVDWAGLPIDLDLAFSQEHRDKVYVQHLMRKRGAQLWRWLQNGAQPCVCNIAADDGPLYPHAAESMSSR
jgi:hypothetical protein